MTRTRLLKITDSQRLLASQGVVIAASMISSALLARALTVSAFGTYSGLVRWGVLVTSLASLSFGHGLAQEISINGRAGLERLWSGALVIGAATGVLAALILVAISPLVNVAGTGMIYYFALGLPAVILAMYGQHFLRGLGDVQGFSANRVLFPCVWLLGVGVWVTSMPGAPRLLGAMWAAAQWLAFGLVCLRLRRYRVGRSLTHPSWRSPLKFGVHSHAAVVGRDASQYVDQLILVAIGGAGALGLYVPAAALAALVGAVGTSVTLMIQPKVAKAPVSSKFQVAWSSVFKTVGYALIISIAVITASGLVVPAVYGAKFEASVPIARVLAGGMLCDIVCLSVIAGLLGMGRPRMGSVFQTILTLALMCGVASGYFASGEEPMGAALGVVLVNLAGAIAAIILLWVETGRDFSVVGAGLKQALGRSEGGRDDVRVGP